MPISTTRRNIKSSTFAIGNEWPLPTEAVWKRADVVVFPTSSGGVVWVVSSRGVTAASRFSCRPASTITWPRIMRFGLVRSYENIERTGGPLKAAVAGPQSDDQKRLRYQRYEGIVGLAASIRGVVRRGTLLSQGPVKVSWPGARRHVQGFAQKRRGLALAQEFQRPVQDRAASNIVGGSNMIDARKRLFTALMGVGSLSACNPQKMIADQANAQMTDIKAQVADEAARQYDMVAAGGSHMDRCVQAQQVAAAFLLAENNLKYASWKRTERSECGKAGLPAM